MAVAKRIKIMPKIGTHSGTFHADESLAVYMLKLLPQFKDAEVVRSRDPETLETCDIIVDVSGKYQEPKYFDHHQRGFDEVFSDKFHTKLSSAGLVYKHFGKDVLKELLKDDEENVAGNEESLEDLYQKIYSVFIESLDANDNGISAYPDDIEAKFKSNNITLPGMVSALNPTWRDPNSDEVMDAQFAKASDLMGKAFENVVNSYGRGWYPAKKHVAAAFNDRAKYDEKGRIVVFENYVPWKEHLYSVEKESDSVGSVLYVLYSDYSNNWRVQAVAESSSSFVSRKPLPEAWRGVRDEQLSELTGIDGCIFVHAAGFIGGAKTFEGVLEMAKKALEE